MTNYDVIEGGDKTVNDVLQDIATVIGDTISYNGNNQMAYVKYEVIYKDGEKSLKVIDSYDKQMNMYDEYSEEEYDGAILKGGRKKRTHKRKSHKRKSHKRKSHKRKSHKRKSHKRMR
jgi:hypothetical protein